MRIEINGGAGGDSKKLLESDDEYQIVDLNKIYKKIIKKRKIWRMEIYEK